MMMHMSQELLASNLGLTFQQIQKYEKGANRVGAGRLLDIAIILRVPISFFFEGAPRAELLPDGKRSFPCTLTLAIWRDVFEWESVRFDQAATVLAKLNGNRSLMSVSTARFGNSVRTWRNQANGSTPQARQVNIRL